MRGGPGGASVASMHSGTRGSVFVFFLCAVCFLLGSSFSAIRHNTEAAGTVVSPSVRLSSRSPRFKPSRSSAPSGSPGATKRLRQTAESSEKQRRVDARGDDSAGERGVDDEMPRHGEGPELTLAVEPPGRSVARRLPTLSMSVDECVNVTMSAASQYVQVSQAAASLRARHGTLVIAAFSRLWVPPIHGAGGMQYHALHLYSQFAAQGHQVHVFVTAPPDFQGEPLSYNVNPASMELVPVTAGDRDDVNKPPPGLTLHRVPSRSNGEYSVEWLENCLKEVCRLNKTLQRFDAAKGTRVATAFQVAHSESWSAVPNAYLIGLPMIVTWHGSMLDWFRNEMNLIVHNFRLNRKMTTHGNSQRMQELGGSAAFEAFMLLTVPHHVVISDSAASDLAALNLVERRKIHLIYNGVNRAHFRALDDDGKAKDGPVPSNSRRMAAKMAFLVDVAGMSSSAADVIKGAFFVGCGGRLEGIKGHHQLSEAMGKFFELEKVKEEGGGAGGGVILLVAGHGGEERRYQRLKDRGHKVFLLGMLPQQNLARFYQVLDVFVDPYYQHHGLNTVMLEAALSGTPLIATDLASTRTTVPCAAYGLTFGLGLVDELVDRLMFMYEHPDVRRQMGERARIRAEKLFGSDVMSGAYEALLYDAYLHPQPLVPVTGKVVCKKVYPAMCYREPE